MPVWLGQILTRPLTNPLLDSQNRVKAVSSRERRKHAEHFEQFRAAVAGSRHATYACQSTAAERAANQASLVQTTHNRHEEALKCAGAPICVADSEHANDDRVIAHSPGQEVCRLWKFGVP